MGIINAAWGILVESSIFIVFGLFIAALIRIFISSESIVKYIGGNNIKSVLWAAVFGVPLPLCSCGVVPTAVALKKQGASKPAIVSFLISTPESSIDSIAITYALIDPLMTIFRPLAAFVSGFVAGIAEIIFGGKNSTELVQESECPHCAKNMNNGELGSHNEPHKHSLGERAKLGFRFAFVELLTDISRWFLVGMLIAGVISYAIPESFIQNHLGEGWLSMFIMLAIALPLYVCATASTPIAAALILKGMSPGAALVFLLAGPATNAASITVLTGMLGKRTVIIYLLSIASCAIILGMILNLCYRYFGIDIHAVAGHAHQMIPMSIKLVFAVPLTILMILFAIYRK